MNDTVTAIVIRNVHVIERVMEQVRLGAGRNAAEAAENLILSEIERRQGAAAGTGKASRPKPRSK